MNDALAPLDRRTLAFWRVSNLVGWAAAGLAVALLIHWIADDYSLRFFATFLSNKMEWVTGWGILPSFGLRLGISLVIGVAVGSIVGGKVWTRPVSIAAAVAAVYASISIFAVTTHPGPVGTYRAGPLGVLVTGPTILHGFGGYGIAGWIHDALTLTAVPVAALTAWFAARRRP